MTGLPGGTAVARVAAVGGTRADPGPAASHGPLPPWHNQRRPAAESAGFPCGPAQPAPLPAASGQAKDEAKDPGPPRQRSRRAGDLPEVPGTAAPEPASLPVPPHAFFPFNLLLAGGFRRISRKNVLDHEARQVICRTIAAMPGTSLKTLGGMTGINENTLRYHLDRLLATGKIASFVRPGIVRYFMNQGTYTQFEYRVFHCLWTVTPSGILRLLHQNPGMTRQELAGALMIAGPSVTRQMENLIDDGIVENRSPGRSNHYYLTAEAARALEKVMGQARPVVPSVAEAALFPVPAG